MIEKSKEAKQLITQKHKEKRQKKRERILQKAKESRNELIEKFVSIFGDTDLPKVLKYSRNKMKVILKEKELFPESTPSALKEYSWRRILFGETSSAAASKVFNLSVDELKKRFLEE